MPEKIAGVGVHMGYAYLAVWGSVTCEDNGVHVVDLRDAKNPREVKFIRSNPGSYPGEGIQTVNITAPKFSGGILLGNNERSASEHTGYGGVNLLDVTRPTRSLTLLEGASDTNDASGVKRKSSNSIHSAFAWDAGDNAYVVIVDNVEITDLDTLGITDPRSLKQVADLAQKFPQILLAAPDNLNKVFHPDVVVKKIGSQQAMTPTSSSCSRPARRRTPRATPTSRSSPSTTNTSSPRTRTSPRTVPNSSPTTTPTGSL